MNSEELEQSLRTEFESYLKNIFADMRQEFSEFQKQFEAEFEKHKAQLDEVFENFSTRISAERETDASFNESVIEHLRLSRDEGARITATAIAEAEEMEKQNAADLAAAQTVAPTVNFSEIRDAINDISTKTTQSAILKALVQHTAQFTPRGAFFIIKNEHLVGWRVFDKSGEGVDEQTVREVFFPVASATVLGEAVRSLSPVESSYGTYSDDSIYLNKLEFGHPEQMYAIPLVVRGRSVAVLYADRGNDNEEVSIEALETLVRVASLTVEILASARGGAQMPADNSEQTSTDYDQTEETSKQYSESRIESPESFETRYVQPETAANYNFAESEASKETDSESLSETTQAETEQPKDSYSYTSPITEDYSYKPFEQPAESFEQPFYETVESDSFAFKPSVEPEAEAEKSADADFKGAPAWNQPVESEEYSTQSSDAYEIPEYEIQDSPYEISDSETVEAEAPTVEDEYAPSLSSSDYQFETNQTYETPQSAEFETNAQSFDTSNYATSSYETENVSPTNGYETAVSEPVKTESYVEETPVEAVVKQPAKSRFSERNVDLPIEVSEDERRLHNDARRFARLLVSEIKLYNEQKVKEGRESSDLYERLREAIDRSREMYDKRVQPPVAAKFDYFHYELVSSLAEGDAGKLGTSYPGASV